MPAIFLWQHTVDPSEIDDLGHVNNLTYLRWTLSAAIAHSTAQGWSRDRYEDEEAAWVVRSHSIEYLRPALPGDEVVVQTWIADFKKVTSLRKYRIERVDGAVLLAQAETNWAYISLRHGVPRRIPERLSDSFTIVPDEAD